MAFSTWRSAIPVGCSATASNDGTGRSVGSEVRHACRDPPGQHGFVSALDFSPDDELIATASRDRMARIFDADAGTLRAALAGHEEAVRDVAFADAQTVATGSTDGTIRLWNATPFPTLRRVETLRSRAEAVAFRGERILSAGRADVRNRLFALSDDPRLAFPARGFEGVARSQPLALGTSEDGRVLVSSIATARSESGGLTTTDSRCDGRSSPNRVLGSVTPSSASSPDGSQFVAGTRSGAANLWSATRKQRAPQFDQGLTSATFGP